MILLANEKIKLAAAGAGVRLWQVAEELGMLDSNLSRKLRHELSDTERQKLLAVICDISGRAKDAETQN